MGMLSEQRKRKREWMTKEDKQIQQRMDEKNKKKYNEGMETVK